MDDFTTPYDDDDAKFIKCKVCDKSIRGETLYKIHLTSPGHLKKEDALVAVDGGSDMLTQNKDLPSHVYGKGDVQAGWFSLSLRAQLPVFGKIAAIIGRDPTPSSPIVQPDISRGMLMDRAPPSHKGFALESTAMVLPLPARQAVRRQNIPVFEHILHYLDYMKLDEPIIGLNYLMELPSRDPHGDLRYKCSLCNHSAFLTEMVRHLIGRKHRQKYVETERPELVTWSKRESHGGKIFKAKAEMIERQDGRGHPVLIGRGPKDTRSHTSGGQPWQMHNWNQKGSLIPQDARSHLPRLMDFKMECAQERGYTQQQPNTSSFHQETPYMLNQGDRDTRSWGRFEGNVQRADHRGRDGRRQAPGDPDDCSNYKERYRQDEQRTVEFEPRIPKSELRSEMPHGWSHSSSQEYCSEEGPFRRGYPERDPMDIFHTEEKRNVQGRSPDYMRLHPDDDSFHWSPDIRQGSREQESIRRSFPTEMKSHQSHDHLVNGHLLQNHKIGDLHIEEAKPVLSRTGLPNPERNADVSRFMSDIPEPFKRFLKGGTNDSEQGKRKRKSRFSDASMEELAKTRRMFEVCGPSEPVFGSYHSPKHPSLRPEMHEIHHSGLIQGPHQNKCYDRGVEKGQTEVVFDMLNNIEIDNKEEADFLKSKLCELLKEFKAKKSEKADKNLSRASISKEFNSLKPEDSLPTRHMYERIPRENSDYSQVENTKYHEDHRESVWEHCVHNMPEESHQEYNHSMPANPSYLNSNLNCHEDVFVRSEISSRQHSNQLSDAASYPRVSLKPAYSRDDEYFDFGSSALSHHMERESTMERSGLYSSSLEKITLTLLELVKRQ